jgi:hypothetical protein
MTENPENKSNVQVPPAPQTNPQPRPAVNNTNTNYSNTTNNIPSQYKPLSPWAYIGYNILFAIPFIGLIMMLVFVFDSSNNLNRRNYARSVLYARIIVIVLSLVIIGVLAATIGLTFISATGSSTSSFTF